MSSKRTSPKKAQTVKAARKTSPKKSDAKAQSKTMGIDLFFTPKRQNSSNFVFSRPPKPPQDHFKCDLWASSSLLPFVKTEASEKVEDWISNFTQSRPCCILYGETSSGKSRIVEQIAVRHSLHVIYIDCAIIRDVRKLMEESNEATQSRSVGGSFGEGLGNSPNSLVVFEHFDALVSNSKVSPTVLQMLSVARVPVIITAYTNVFKPETWLLPVFCSRPENAEQILCDAQWIRKGSNEQYEEYKESVRKILFMTYNDIRKTALQMMFMRNSHRFLPRDEQLYHSIPSYCVSEDTVDMEMYSVLMDSLCVIDPDDLVFDQYIESDDIIEQPMGYRERKMKEKANELHKRIPHSKTSFMPDAEILEIGSNAAQNAVMRTRTLKMMPIPNVQFTSSEIDELAYCYLFE